MKQLMKFQAQKKSLNKYTWYMETHFCRFIYKLNYYDASFHLQNHLSTLLFPVVDEGKNQILSIVSNRNRNFWRIIVHLAQKV